MASQLYACINTIRISDGHFESLLLTLILAALDHHDGSFFEANMDEGEATYARGSMDTLAHQLSCLIAQRYDISVPMSDTIDTLMLDKVMPATHRAALISYYIHALRKEKVA